MNIDITNDSYEISLLSAEVIYSDLPVSKIPISIFANTGIKQHYIANRDGFLEIVHNNISYSSNPFVPKGIDLEQSGLNDIQSDFEIATIEIHKSRGNIMSMAIRCILGKEWHYDGINGTININTAQDFASSYIKRYVKVQDRTYLLGVDQHPELQTYVSKMNSLASLATLPANVGLTPNIDEYDMDALVKVLTEINIYFSTGDIETNEIQNESEQKDILFIVSTNIHMQTYKSFNAGGEDYRFTEDLIKKFMPSAKYVTTSLINNSMFVLDTEYCEFIIGKPASFNFKETGHTTASLLATSAIGSVVCKDPSKILYYKDFVNPPATRTIRTRNVAPASTKTTASDALTTTAK